MSNRKNFSIFSSCKELKEVRKESKEIHVDFSGYSFDKVIAGLNYILAIEKSDKKKNIKTKRLIKLFSAEATDEATESEQLVEQLTNFFGYVDSKGFNSIRAVFNKYDIEAYIGNKISDTLYCNQIVIGLKGQSFRYRVDYDPSKKLHINVVTKHGIKLSITTACNSKRFGVSDAQIPAEYAGKEDEFRSVYIKFKFWLKMTLGYQSVTYYNKKELPEQNIFVSFSRGEVGNFKTFKEQCAPLIEDQTIANKVSRCKIENLHKLVFKNKNIRDYFINFLIFKITKHKYFATEVSNTDSEAIEHTEAISESVTSPGRR